ncbi:hypothetical protein ACQEVS_10075 [Streptomyces sp. CA-181903]|uniref:hypothetical protein n=1 Tax=Streptomyces sp. CA-181903 TaxID=3240055 RepID=UPI003D8D394B
MTALAVEISTAPWAGRAIVRAAGGLTLHVAVEGAQVPAAAMFTVPVECRPDAESAPGVRPWSGPVDEGRLCVPCLQALRNGPGLGTARVLPAGAAPASPPPAPEPDGKGRRLLAELGGRPLRWSKWGETPHVS